MIRFDIIPRWSFCDLWILSLYIIISIFFMPLWTGQGKEEGWRREGTTCLNLMSSRVEPPISPRGDL